MGHAWVTTAVLAAAAVLWAIGRGRKPGRRGGPIKCKLVERGSLVTNDADTIRYFQCGWPMRGVGGRWGPSVGNARQPPCCPPSHKASTEVMRTSTARQQCAAAGREPREPATTTQQNAPSPRPPPTSAPNGRSVVSWNILADDLKHKLKFVHPDFLAWEHRRCGSFTGQGQHAYHRKVEACTEGLAINQPSGSSLQQSIPQRSKRKVCSCRWQGQLV